MFIRRFYSAAAAKAASTPTEVNVRGVFAHQSSSGEGSSSNTSKPKQPTVVSDFAAHIEKLSIRRVASLSGIIQASKEFPPIAPNPPAPASIHAGLTKSRKERMQAQKPQYVPGWTSDMHAYDPETKLREWDLKVDGSTFNPLDRRLAQELAAFHERRAAKDGRIEDKLYKQVNKTLGKNKFRDAGKLLDGERLRLEARAEKMDREGPYMGVPLRFRPRTERERVVSMKQSQVQAAMAQMPGKLKAFDTKRRARGPRVVQ